VPHKRWHSVTLLASITTTGMGAAMVLDGALARESFDAYVEQLLLPTLVPGQVVVLDNLPVHKSARARALIEGTGCSVLFLPAYSPTSIRSSWPSPRSSRPCVVGRNGPLPALSPPPRLPSMP